MVKILVVEHSLIDIEELRKELDASFDAYTLRLTKTKIEFEDALQVFKPDVILSNYKVPEFNWDDAFRLRQEMAPTTPFILLSDNIDAEHALDLIKSGITDCVLRSMPNSLIPTIQRALKDAEKNQAERLAHEALSKSILTLRTVFDNTDIGFMFLGKEHQVLAYNKVCTKWAHILFGVLITEGMIIDEMFTPDRLPAFQVFFDKVINGDDITYETSFPKSDNTLMWFVINGKAVKDGDATIGICTSITDVTATKFTAESIRKLNGELRTANNQLTAILSALPANIALLDKTGKIMTVNEAWKRFALDNNMHGSAYGLGDNYIEVCLNATGIEGAYGHDMAQGIQDVLSGKLDEYSLEYPCHSSYAQRWFKAEVRLYVDGYIGVVVMHIDITKIKLAEEAVVKLNAALEERVLERTNQLMESNASLEAFSYSVSHDLRTPLRSLIGFAKIINRQHGGSLHPEVIELLSHIESNSRRMNNIIDNLLNLAKYGKAQLSIQHIDIHALFADAWNSLLLSTGSSATLDLHKLPMVYADSSLMHQVIINLLSNAIKYTSKQEKPHVEVGHTQDCDMITIYVRDNGVGFDMKYYSRLFGAFQRLHGVTDFEGTGIGLNIIKRIVEKHGGKVWAEAEVDTGAIFFFSLPLSQANPANVIALEKAYS